MLKHIHNAIAFLDGLCDMADIYAVVYNSYGAHILPWVYHDSAFGLLLALPIE
jgi:hypothetical protein